jgi:hypothetical protein
MRNGLPSATARSESPEEVKSGLARYGLLVGLVMSVFLLFT